MRNHNRRNPVETRVGLTRPLLHFETGVDYYDAQLALMLVPWITRAVKSTNQYTPDNELLMVVSIDDERPENYLEELDRIVRTFNANARRRAKKARQKQDKG